MALQACLFEEKNLGKSETATCKSNIVDFVEAIHTVLLSLGMLWSFCTECSEQEFRSCSRKILALTILLYGFILYAYYTSYMSAFLTISKYKKVLLRLFNSRYFYMLHTESDYIPFDSMEQLADSEYNIAVEKNTITQYFFSETNTGTTRRYQ